jgi:hypothetical protein
MSRLGRTKERGASRGADVGGNELLALAWQHVDLGAGSRDGREAGDGKQGRGVQTVQNCFANPD